MIDLIVITDGDKTTAEKDEKTAERSARSRKPPATEPSGSRRTSRAPSATEKRKDNAAHLVVIAEKLDLANLPPKRSRRCATSSSRSVRQLAQGSEDDHVLDDADRLPQPQRA